MEIICNTARLYLRKFANNDDDASNILAMNRLPEVLQYLHELPLKTLEDAYRILKQHILPQYQYQLGRWSVHLKENDDFIGWCGLKKRPERNNEIDLGYRFLPAYWNQGFAQESSIAVLDHAFKNLLLNQVNACAHIENRASWKILEKIGMRFTGEDIIDHCPVKCYMMGKADWTR